jgi:tetratricopeptide (TPR) repeat protein
VIHAFDDPLHAQQGLEAARAYSKIAPDAAHAQHMTTHIFLALGMWDEVVSQNEIASHHTDWRSGHYVSWYTYGLLQQGRRREAAAVLERARKDWPANLRPALKFMRAHQVILTEQWDDPSLGWEIPNPPGTTPRAIEEFVQGYAALQRGDRRQAQARRGSLTALAEEAARKGDTPIGRALPGILGRELEAAILHAEGRGDEAVTLLQQAAEQEASLPVEFGPPFIVKPTFELLGEVLLALDRPAEAVRAFTRALDLAPRRAPSLLGLARSADKAGDAALAVQTWETLAEVWRKADPEVIDRLTDGRTDRRTERVP